MAACGGGGQGPSGREAGSTSGEHSSSSLTSQATGGASFRVAGADNSIPDFGHEGSISEREKAAEVARTYLHERIDGREPTACTMLTARARRDVLKAASRITGSVQVDCVAALEVLTPSPYRDARPSIRKKILQIDAGGLRVKGDVRVLLYHGGSEPPIFMVLVAEGPKLKIAFPEPRRIYLGRPALIEVLRVAVDPKTRRALLGK
jgi:hypothetical protein